MNKFVLLAVVCLLGTAAADTRFRRDILPGDARYNAGNSGYSYNQPQHHHQAPAASQPSRSYLQPVQEAKQTVTIARQERPQKAYLAPKVEVAAPTFQIEQVRSVEHHSYTETTHQQPAPSYGAPQRTIVKAQAPVVPHTTYGAPPSAPTNQIVKVAPVPHKTYGAPQMNAPRAVPHTTYGAPVAQQYIAPAPAKIQSFTVQAPAKAQVNVASYSHVASAPAQKTYAAPSNNYQQISAAPSRTYSEVKVELPQTSYGTPFKSYEAPAVHAQASYEAPVAQVHSTYEAPVAQVHSTYEAPVAQVHSTYEAPAAHAHATYEAPAVHAHATYEAPAVHAHATYEAPASHSYDQQQSSVHVHHEEHVEEQLPAVHSTQIFREPAQTYIPVAPVAESESVSVDSNNHSHSYSESHSHSDESSQPIGENGGYVY